MLRKFYTHFLCCLLILSLLSGITVFATDHASEPLGSIRFEFSVDGKAMESGSLLVIQVAQYNENGTYIWTDAFTDCGLSPEDLSEKDAVQLLADHAANYSGPFWVVSADGSGSATMEQLELGLYLVLQNELFDNRYEVLPYVLAVPSWDADEPNCDVVSIPKISARPFPSPPTPPSIPKTGQLNWPIPVLLLCGSVLVLLGVLLRKKSRNET